MGGIEGARPFLARGWHLPFWVTTFDRAFLRTSNLWSTLVEFTRSLMVVWTATIFDGSKISALDNLARIHSVDKAEVRYSPSK